jgi:Zn ribbon nucleic-acid-binding protein
MPNRDRSLPIQCPKCHHDGSTLLIKSYTVMTLMCVSCRHMWASDLMSLPAEVQKKIPDTLQVSSLLH